MDNNEFRFFIGQVGATATIEILHPYHFPILLRSVTLSFLFDLSNTIKERLLDAVVTTGDCNFGAILVKI
jgi:hypothetical protein